MVLKDKTGAVVDVAAGEAAFHASLAAPEPAAAPVSEMPAPPKVDPEAPYGRTKDGQPKKGPGGRPAKDADKPRVLSQAEAAVAGGDGADFTQGLLQVGALVHTGMVMVPAVHPQAALFKGCMPGMAEAWNYAAQCNSTVRTGVAWLAQSDIGWIAAVSLSTLPFIQGAIGLWQDPKGEAATMLRAATAADIQAAKDAQAAALLQMAGAGAAAA